MFRLRILRLANPLVRAILDSRAHRLLSGRLIVLGYTGRRSGRPFRIPVQYAETATGALVVIAANPDAKLWWRAFAEPAAAILTLRGAPVHMRGVVATGDERERALEAYVGRVPRSAGLAREAAIVVFTPVPG